MIRYVTRYCKELVHGAMLLKVFLKWSCHLPKARDMVDTDNSAARLVEAIHGCWLCPPSGVVRKTNPKLREGREGAEGLLSLMPVFVSKLSLPAPLSPSTGQPDPWRSSALLPDI